MHRAFTYLSVRGRIQALGFGESSPCFHDKPHNFQSTKNCCSPSSIGFEAIELFAYESPVRISAHSKTYCTCKNSLQRIRQLALHETADVTRMVLRGCGSFEIHHPSSVSVRSHVICAEEESHLEGERNTVTVRDVIDKACTDI